jgi:hypothetical protein
LFVDGQFTTLNPCSPEDRANVAEIDRAKVARVQALNARIDPATFLERF